ncbi:hypothetical protein SAMN04244548_03755 [Paracoccus pantotrophus]|nr:hypothetical protein SAMN04244548_03755 [Paracoccus pantotrophus]
MRAANRSIGRSPRGESRELGQCAARCKRGAICIAPGKGHEWAAAFMDRPARGDQPSKRMSRAGRWSFANGDQRAGGVPASGANASRTPSSCTKVARMIAWPRQACCPVPNISARALVVGVEPFRRRKRQRIVIARRPDHRQDGPGLHHQGAQGNPARCHRSGAGQAQAFAGALRRRRHLAPMREGPAGPAVGLERAHPPVPPAMPEAGCWRISAMATWPPTVFPRPPGSAPCPLPCPGSPSA